MKIVSPTYRRAGKVKAVDVFGEDLVLAVHSFEVRKYSKAYPKNKILKVPDQLQGNMAVIRNFILDKVKDEYLLMVDDDVSIIGYNEGMKMLKMDQDQVRKLIITGFQMAEDLGTILWGINLQTDPKFYREFTPISFITPILGPFSGIINRDPDLRYDVRQLHNEDYDFFLQVLHKYHKVLRFNKYHYKAEHINMEGGVGSYRLLEDEISQGESMIKKWGDRIVTYDFKKSINPRVRVPIKGI